MAPVSDPPIMLVEWLDSIGLDDGGWMDAENVARNVTLDAMHHESVGYLVEDNPEGIALAGSRNLSGELEHRGTKLANVGVIPRAAILTMTPLRPARKRSA
jgi:hypothetical protein